VNLQFRVFLGILQTFNTTKVLLFFCFGNTIELTTPYGKGAGSCKHQFLFTTAFLAACLFAQWRAVRD